MSADGRARLIAAAVSVVQVRGYDGAGLSAILAVAGLPKGSLYHHFPGGKDELVATAVDFLADEVERRILDLVRAGLGLEAITQRLFDDTLVWMAASGWRSVGLIGALGACLPGDAQRTAQALTAAQTRFHAALAQTGAPDPAIISATCHIHGRLTFARINQDARANHTVET